MTRLLHNTIRGQPVRVERASAFLGEQYAFPACITSFVTAACAAGFEVHVEAPPKEDGEWFLDIEKEEVSETVSWHKATGFGFYTCDRGYGDRPCGFDPDAESALLRLNGLLN